jgi:hypothetical protein
MKVIQITRSKEDILVNDVCVDLERYFSKHYAMLLELSEFRFRFRTAQKRVAEELNETKLLRLRLLNKRYVLDNPSRRASWAGSASQL